MYQIGFDLFYCLKCAVTTGHSIVVKRTESETLKYGYGIREYKRHRLFFRPFLQGHCHRCPYFEMHSFLYLA
ncbi:hypothetical protein OOU_Y34scaffold01191g3 [Pyricularia oryzae Y34]|uniref:Uncharacterized protein n=1 Tax=Pyricularia oryzae (strain Y34) TaxID=1143189 RepID=A0AA97NLF3_PYRO3|nr:hypothetical protein OOU_Y34scaffold01191g3 [Pyricularia oryzae Y34]